MLEFAIIARGLFQPKQVIMHYDPVLRMPTTPDLQQWMDTLWQEKVVEANKRGARLFDAPLFRFVDASMEGATLHVIVGDTGYKEYVTTRTPEFAGQHLRQELGNALSVCSVVETSDHHILLDKRQGVDVYEGRYHVIGGFFERELDRASTTSVACPDPFGAMRREIREETGIQATDIEEQYCVGVVYDLAMPHAEMCFLMRLNITLDEVIYHRVPEDDEIKRLHALQRTPESLRKFILQHHGNISATGEPNLLLYGALQFGEAWFEEIMYYIG